MPHSYSTLLVHVVFGTKDRVRSMNASIRPELFAYMGGIVREIGGVARTINGIEDHVHILITSRLTRPSRNACAS
jgi:putative transposase